MRRPPAATPPGWRPIYPSGAPSWRLSRTCGGSQQKHPPAEKRATPDIPLLRSTLALPSCVSLLRSPPALHSGAPLMRFPPAFPPPPCVFLLHPLVRSTLAFPSCIYLLRFPPAFPSCASLLRFPPAFPFCASILRPLLRIPPAFLSCVSRLRFPPVHGPELLLAQTEGRNRPREGRWKHPFRQ